jgi:hypothetical protein
MFKQPVLTQLAKPKQGIKYRRILYLGYRPHFPKLDEPIYQNSSITLLEAINENLPEDIKPKLKDKVRVPLYPILLNWNDLKTGDLHFAEANSAIKL